MSFVDDAVKQRVNDKKTKRFNGHYKIKFQNIRKLKIVWPTISSLAKYIHIHKAILSDRFTTLVFSFASESRWGGDSNPSLVSHW